MSEYRFEKNDLLLKQETEDVFDRFNGAVGDNPEGAARAIAYAAFGHESLLDETEQKLAATANEILDVTNDGTGLDASDSSWGVIFNDPDHKAARHEVYRLDTETEEGKAAVRFRGYCALRAVALTNLPEGSSMPTMEEVEKEIESNRLLVVA